MCVCMQTYRLRACNVLSTVLWVHGKHSESVYAFNQHDCYYCYSVARAPICIGLHHLITKLLRKGAILTHSPENEDVTEVQ